MSPFLALRNALQLTGASQGPYADLFLLLTACADLDDAPPDPWTHPAKPATECLHRLQAMGAGGVALDALRQRLNDHVMREARA